MPATGPPSPAFRAALQDSERPERRAATCSRIEEGHSAVTNNLTRDEARDRAGLLDVVSYQVELDLTAGEETFPSVSTVLFRCSRPGAASFINLTAPAVSEIILNGEPVGIDAFDSDRIALAPLAAENELRVVAHCAYSRSGEGMHRFADPVDGGVYLYTDLETFDAHRVYACFDQPDLKASFELTVTAPDGWQVISNMAPDVAGAPAGDGATRRRPGRWRPGRRCGPALAFPAVAGDVHLHHGGRGRPVLRRPGRARRHSAGHLLPGIAGRLPRPR